MTRCRTAGDLLHRHELTLQLDGESADLLGAELEGETIAVNIEDLVAATLQHSQPLSYLVGAGTVCMLSAFHKLAFAHLQCNKDERSARSTCHDLAWLMCCCGAGPGDEAAPEPGRHDGSAVRADGSMRGLVQSRCAGICASHTKHVATIYGWQADQTTVIHLLISSCKRAATGARCITVVFSGFLYNSWYTEHVGQVMSRRSASHIGIELYWACPSVLGWSFLARKPFRSFSPPFSTYTICSSGQPNMLCDSAPFRTLQHDADHLPSFLQFSDAVPIVWVLTCS